MLPRFIQTAALGSLVVIAFPIIKRTLRPVLREVSHEMNFLLVSSGEKVQDMVSEVKFERMKRQLGTMETIDCEVYEDDDQ